MRAGRGILIVVDLTVQLRVGNGSDRVVPEIWYVYIYHFRSHGTRHLRDTRPVSSHCDPAALFAVIEIERDTILHCDVVGEVEEWRSSGSGVEVEWRSSGGLVHGEYAEMRWRREESGDKIMEVGGDLTEVMHFLRQNSRQILKYRNWPSAGEVRAADLVLIGIRVGNRLASCFMIMMQYASRWQDVVDLSLQSCIESIWRKIYQRENSKSYYYTTVVFLRYGGSFGDLAVDLNTAR